MAGTLLALLCAGPALGAFPGTDPHESPRENTPNDPRFDACEPDDAEPPEEENEGEEDCDSYWGEQYGLFGFRPSSANDLTGPTTYDDCRQADEHARRANQQVHGSGHQCDQVSGVRADLAWKRSAGDPDVVVAIFDNGIEWGSSEIRNKVRLNAGELPTPAGAGETLEVDDFTGHVEKNAGHDEWDDVLDASDLIATYSDGGDADGNGYADDVAGWDFFDDDNDPFDQSDCCQSGHGTGRMREAAAATNNGRSEAGVCPRCTVLPVRTSDSIVHDTNLVALGTRYAADNGASATACACGGLLNTSFARRAFEYADSKGVTQLMVSSDINSANHNYPTNYDEAIYVSGTLPDTAPGESCETPGLLIGVDEQEAPGCKELLGFLEEASSGRIAPSSQPPTTSFFRNPNLTQYGGHADIVLVGSTGSQNTGQAAGAAGLIQSYARERLKEPLAANEVRQLLTQTAEDVLPGNLGSLPFPDKATEGWDTHFGFGRVNLAEALERIDDELVPPQVQLKGPDWFAPIDVDRVGAGGVPVRARVSKPRFADGVSWRLEYKCGQDPGDGGYQRLAAGDGDVSGTIGRIPRSVLTSLADRCDGSVADDPGRPAGQPGDLWPEDPYPKPDPERHAFQLRLQAWDPEQESNRGEYRKTLFAYRDDGNRPGWPRPVGPGEDRMGHVTGSGGEASPRLVDLDADNRLDVLLATSSGELQALRADGSPLPSWNGGRPVRTRPYPQARGGGPLEPLRVPAVGDMTGDGEPEVAVTAGEHMYVWDRRGRALRGFPVRIDPSFSRACKSGAPRCFKPSERFKTDDRAVKRGFFASPALADLDRDGRLDVVAGALDQHLYAWDGDGQSLEGFPVRLDSGSAEDGAEIVASPAIADLDGNGDPEIVVATNEVLDECEGASEDPDDLFSTFIGEATGFSVTYAVHGDGKRVDGWPVCSGALAADLLPVVFPGEDAAAGDLDPAREGDEVSITTGTGGAKLVGGDGDVIRSYSATPGPASRVTDRTAQLNLAEYPSIGRFAPGARPSVIKGGLSLVGAANLLATNQNLPFNHAVQAWDPTSGQYLPRWPVATDDFQLFSQPAIAKVGGSGSGRQAIVGTGLYQLHAYGEDGTEPSGWPKFTGGWQAVTPALGDMDGDGKLDLTTVTREGWAFAWRTGVDACTNSEWWTFHHDEHGTARYGHDARPPSRPGPVSAERLPNGDLRIAFGGSGDDLRCGEPRRYEVAGSSGPIDSGAEFVRAERLTTERAATTRAAGDRVALTVEGGARFAKVAVRAVDDAGNVSYVSGERARSAAAAPGESPETSPRPDAASPAADRPGAEGRGGQEGGRDEGRGGLPFTGLGLGLLALLGVALAAAGLRLRRRAA